MIKNTIMKKTAMNLLAATALPLLLLASACSTESRFEEPLTPDNPDQQTERREVMLTLNNKLSIQTDAAPRAAIATAEENYIQSLDVYVFAAKEENGNYTLQELHYYRDNAAPVTTPGVDTYSFNLIPAAGADNNITTGLLKLRKGLFVKLYCIANRTRLYQTDAGGTLTEFTAFKSLAQSAPGQADNKVTEGVPTEADFKKFHTNPIDPATPAPTADDVLTTPLPMTGAYTTPLDLTDFSSSARTQISFKLTRMVARFDIVNNADASRFTIENISMGNGQPAVQFFPIQTLATDAADLIIYPARPVSPTTQQAKDDVKGTTDLTAGAFYTWPSPMADQGYLTLKGKYAVNKTETRDVSYRVPFQQTADGIGSYIEVACNHRYTIAITKADDYHLDFTLNVTDWEDDGSMDDYDPQNDFGKLKLTQDAFTSEAYLRDNNVVELLAHTGSKFAFFMGSNTELTEEIIYNPNGSRWIKRGKTQKGDARAISAIDSLYTYEVDDTPGNLDDRNRLLPVIVRLTNPASGAQKTVKVVPAPGPDVTLTPGGYDHFYPNTMTAALYNVAGHTTTMHITAPTRPDGSGGDVTGSTAALATDLTTYFDIAPDPAGSDLLPETDYVLTQKAAAPDLTLTGWMDFTSTATKEKTRIKIELKDPAMPPLKATDFAMNTNSPIDMAGAAPKATLKGVKGNFFTVNIISPEGVDVAITGGTDWLETIIGTPERIDPAKTRTPVTVRLKENVNGKTDGEITFTNLVDNTQTQVVKVEVPTTIEVAPTVTQFVVPGELTLDADYDEATNTATVYNSVESGIMMTASAECEITTNEDWLFINGATNPDTGMKLYVAQIMDRKDLATTGTVRLTDISNGKYTDVTIKLKNADIIPLAETDFTVAGGGTATYDAVNKKLVIHGGTADGEFAIKVTSPRGVRISRLDDPDKYDYILEITEQKITPEECRSNVNFKFRPGVNKPTGERRFYLDNSIDQHAHGIDIQIEWLP